MKLYLATPMYAGQCTVPYAASIVEATKKLKEKGVETRLDFLGNESLIQRARNLMAHKFYKSDCSHLLFVDADIGFDFDQIWRLLTQSMEVESQQSVLTGVYCKKYLNWDRIREKREGKLNTIECLETVGLDYNVNVELGKLGLIQNGFVNVLDAATGFMLIPRSVLEKLYAAYEGTLTCRNDLMDQNHTYIAVFDCMICPQSSRYLSEDFSFIRRCQAQGITVKSDMTSKLSHTGTMVIGNFMTHS